MTNQIKTPRLIMTLPHTTGEEAGALAMLAEFYLKQTQGGGITVTHAQTYPLTMRYLDLYHRTSEESANLILATGSMVSRENTAEAYFSTEPSGHAAGYGDTCLHVRVPDHLAELEDEFPNGEQHYRVKVSSLAPEHFIGVVR